MAASFSKEEQNIFDVPAQNLLVMLITSITNIDINL